MKKNKLILFDWGNIVESHKTGYTCYDAWRDLIDECGYTGEYDLSKYRLSAIPNLYQFEKVFNEMKEEFRLNVTFQEFIEKYHRIFNRIDYYPNVRDYELSLKDKCYVGILSNLLIFDKERLDNQVGLDNYDYVFLSFEMACRKPDKEIYEKVQEKLDFNKEDILFVDDRSDNIEAAKEFGWNTFKATGLELDKIKEACESFLNK